MTNQKIDTLLEYLQSAVETLQELRASQNDAIHSKLSDELSATTTSVYLRTGVLYSWKELKRWCNAHHFQPKKLDHYGLSINSYPASAWKEVFDINLDTVMTLPETTSKV